MVKDLYIIIIITLLVLLLFLYFKIIPLKTEIAKLKWRNRSLSGYYEDLEKELPELRREILNKDKSKIDFVIQNSIYNNNNLAIYRRYTALKSNYTYYNIEEYSFKSEFDSKNRLINEDYYIIENGNEVLKEFSEFIYEKNKEIVITFCRPEGIGIPKLSEKQEIITDVINNSKIGYIEYFDEPDDKTARIDFIEKYDNNNNLVERIQKSTIAFYENTKRIYHYKNNKLVEEKIFEFNKSKNRYSKNPKNNIKYTYRKDGSLKKKEIFNSDCSYEIKKTYYINAINEDEFNKAIIKSNEYCKLYPSDLRYLSVISKLIFINETICKFEINKEKIIITAEIITKQKK